MRCAAALFLAIAAASPALGADGHEWFHRAVYTTNPDEQILYYNRALKENPHHYQAMHNLAGAYHRKGLTQKAITLYERMIAEGRAYYQTYYNLACGYAVIGEREKALAALKVAVRKGFRDSRLIERDADLDNIRDDPRFQKIVASRRSPGPRDRASTEAEEVATAGETTSDQDGAPAAKAAAARHVRKSRGAQSRARDAKASTRKTSLAGKKRAATTAGSGAATNVLVTQSELGAPSPPVTQTSPAASTGPAPRPPSAGDPAAGAKAAPGTPGPP